MDAVVVVDGVATRSAGDRRGIRALLADVHDQGLLHHGFTDYMRDYELVITASSDPRLGRPVDHLSYLFVNCVSARVESTVSPAVWGRSTSDELVHPDPQRTYDAFVWGVGWQGLYPTFDLRDESATANHWARALGTPFHELHVVSDAHEIALVFSELRVRHVPAGYAPFVVRPGD